MTPGLAVDEDPVLGHHADLDPAAGQQLVQPAVAIPVQQRLDLGWGFVPAFLERRLADVLRDGHIGRIQFAVADDLHLGDGGDLLADQLEDRAAEVAGDALVGLRILQPGAQEGVVEPLAAGGEAVDYVFHKGLFSQ